MSERTRTILVYPAAWTRLLCRQGASSPARFIARVRHFVLMWGSPLV